MGQRIRVTTIKPKDQSKIKRTINIFHVQQGSNKFKKVEVINHPPGTFTTRKAVAKRTTPRPAKKD